MNTLSSYSMVGPYGKEDTCAKFDIDDINSIFVFNGIVIPGQEYAFGCWLKSEADGSIMVGDEQIACSSEDWVGVSVVLPLPQKRSRFYSERKVPIIFIKLSWKRVIQLPTGLPLLKMLIRISSARPIMFARK